MAVWTAKILALPFFLLYIQCARLWLYFLDMLAFASYYSYKHVCVYKEERTEKEMRVW